MTDLFIDELQTPLGPFALIADGRGRLHAAGWTDGDPRMTRLLGKASARAIRAEGPHGLRDAMTDYFEGDLGALDRIEVVASGTAFQRAVWEALRSIPHGETRSYAQLAQSIGRPRAVRAVGLANGQNPVAVVVPCHRVIGSDGSLTGYGGGLPRKRWLLLHEGIQPARRSVEAAAG